MCHSVLSLSFPDHVGNKKRFDQEIIASIFPFLYLSICQPSLSFWLLPHWPSQNVAILRAGSSLVVTPISGLTFQALKLLYHNYCCLCHDANSKRPHPPLQSSPKAYWQSNTRTFILFDMSLIGKTKLIISGGLLLLAVSIFLSDSALPSSVELYGLKRLQEKIFMGIKTNPDDKVNYYNLLLDKRLSELVVVVENRQANLILTSSLRYSTTAGLMTEVIKTHRLADAAVATQEKFKEHQKIIRKLDDSYPKDENEEWKFIQDDYNYLAIYSQQLTDTFADETKVQ